MSIVLGIDGGGTRTRALLVSSDGHILGAGTGPASNPNNLGVEPAVSVWRAVMQAAWRDARQPELTPAACFIGCAGIKAASDCRRLGERAAAAGLGPQDCCLAANDTEAALAGGLPGQPGLVLIVGTGSFCLGRNARGTTARCGGWGWLMDDVGSGFFLGREALRAVALAADGRGPATALSQVLLDHFGISDPDELLARVYPEAADASRVAALAPWVLAASEEDLVARRILEAGAAGLAELVRQVARALGENAPSVILAGGLATSGSPYQGRIESSIREAVPGVKLTLPELPPVAGAALRALELLGVKPTPALRARLRAGCARVGLASPASSPAPC